MTTAVVSLTDVGEGLDDAIILEWKVKPGDLVQTNQTLLEVETVKAVVEVPAPCDGTVLTLEVKEGDTVPVGTTLATLSTTEPATPAAPLPASPLAKPSVRKYARDHQIDLTTIVGTGADGQITEDDLANHQAHRPNTAAAVSNQVSTPAAPGGHTTGDRDTAASTSHIPVTAVRRATADAVTRSFFSAPHATVFLETDATATIELVRRLRAREDPESSALTPLAVVAAAVVRAVDDVPEINSVWDGSSDVITRHHVVNLGVAVATERGLLVPNIPDAQNLSVLELASAIADKVRRARAGTLTPAEFTGGTLTISNVGPLGIDTATPIVNSGESAILCIGTIRKRPWVVDDTVVVRSTAHLSLSFDHRLIDGDTAARALTRIAEVLEEPLWHLHGAITPPAPHR
ncbi:dihydrolipoamide acetyltransferase family protein [Rhodococcus jostii]|uniref:Dihydrolipoamide acetyltransferase component of pyruvate dehydrogenase complex n=1 Tax=Rhodococcus jostii TaxID=132919 RepID=A0ABU4CT88_RHOJO|nr:dihydrolipoamide acetyltransferase family protein [Rhodococcus jostii]MDV6286790.1 dihydrolipoamide acetyltransferase family protein [Rhodococcus jostii]